ncbi:hypothetical protein pdam_00008455 [Pocillopora damicornis]|uniref:Uncharacterized protein n=1 Tax=Pocillopora damicornis TaxID=46731 RepID=A0A3M6TVR3_POCDA|nr:hypothetical protein pdam_00008455 [Pocillopora damicornis]
MQSFVKQFTLFKTFQPLHRYKTLWFLRLIARYTGVVSPFRKPFISLQSSELAFDTVCGLSSLHNTLHRSKKRENLLEKCFIFILKKSTRRKHQNYLERFGHNTSISHLHLAYRCYRFFSFFFAWSKEILFAIDNLSYVVKFIFNSNTSLNP